MFLFLKLTSKIFGRPISSPLVTRNPGLALEFKKQERKRREKNKKRNKLKPIRCNPHKAWNELKYLLNTTYVPGTVVDAGILH